MATKPSSRLYFKRYNIGHKLLVHPAFYQIYLGKRASEHIRTFILSIGLAETNETLPIRGRHSTDTHKALCFYFYRAKCQDMELAACITFLRSSESYQGRIGVVDACRRRPHRRLPSGGLRQAYP